MPQPCLPDDLVVESIRFPAGPYRLEGELVYRDGPFPSGAAVVAGPHPLLGGNMHNNVVRRLSDGLAQHGLGILRFNYRGVGGSAGPAVDLPRHLAAFWQTSHVPNELDYHLDLAGAVALLRSAVPGALPLAVIGYSFGCSLLPQVADSSTALVLVAPTVGTHNYDAFASAANAKLVIAPEGDFAADAEHLRRWFEQLPAPKQLVQPRCDGHFFRGHEEWLVETVSRFLHCQWR